jgi:hypothetical protein
MCRQNYWRWQYWCQQNIGVNKIRASTKPWPRKILPSTKSWRRRRRITLLFGSAESTAADFSQAQLKISYVSLMVLLSLHAVVKCGIASSRLAFMGGLSPVQAYCTSPPCWKRHKFWRQQNIGVHLKFTDFCQTTAVYISARGHPIKKWWK